MTQTTVAPESDVATEVSNADTPVVTMQQLLDAGVHFGHQTRRWNPRMQRFIHGEMSGIYIIDLIKTMKGIEAAYAFVRDTVANDGSIMFVGTKKQVQKNIRSYAERCGMPYINQRWLGGTLTNFATIHKRVEKMREFQQLKQTEEYTEMPKKDALRIQRELDKLERNLSGIRKISQIPDVIFVFDVLKEKIAVTEANKLNIPIVAVVDTNCDPDVIQYVIPGNDDAIRVGDLMCRIICDAVIEGKQIAAARGKVHASERPSKRAADDPNFMAAQEKAKQAAAAEAAVREARIKEQKESSAKAEPEAMPDADEAAAPAADTPAEDAGAPTDAAAAAAAESSGGVDAWMQSDETAAEPKPEQSQ